MTFTRTVMALSMAVAITGAATAAEQPVKAGIVPGADVLLRFDAAGMLASPMYQFLEKQFGGAETENAKMDELMATHLGITDKDIIAVVGSAVTATLLELEPGTTPDWNTFPVAASMLLRKPVTAQKLAVFLDAVNAEIEPGEYEMTTAGGRPAVKIISDGPGEPPLFVTFSEDGMAAYMALTKAGLETAVQRAKGTLSAELGAELSALRNQVPTGTQMALLYRAPKELRQKIAETAAEAAKTTGAGMNPMASMGVGLLKMFENIQSVGLGVRSSDALNIYLGGDLGGAPQAQQTAMMLQNMVVPMLQMQLAGMVTPGEAPIDATKLVSIGSDGNMLKISLNLDQALMTKIQAMQAAAMQAPGMMGPGPGSMPPPSGSMR